MQDSAALFILIQLIWYIKEQVGAEDSGANVGDGWSINSCIDASRVATARTMRHPEHFCVGRGVLVSNSSCLIVTWMA